MIQLLIQYADHRKIDTVDYHQAQKQFEINMLKVELSNKIETARYLAGNKRGAWGLTTRADEKRSNEISNLRFKIRILESKSSFS